MNCKKLLFVSMMFLSLVGLSTSYAAPAVAASEAQQAKGTRAVSGTVVDSYSGEAIIGAYVTEAGNESNTVITDIDGNFTITVPAKKSSLEVSYVGYKPKTVDITGMANIKIELDTDNELEEIVVVGSGVQKKVSITGAIASVDGEQLRMPSSSLTTGLAGKLAGVIQMTNSGAPGSTGEFYIRGISTFGGRAEPLILLDDVEISSGDLNRIPPETIKSFTILKDASATAIYGVRGANGVMIVTTKQGAANTRAKVGVSLENTFVSPMKMVDFVDGATWMSLYNEASMARGGQPYYSQEDIDYTASGMFPYAYPDVDWMDVMFKKLNVNQRANVNIQGGGNRATYYMSIQFNHDTGIVDAPTDYIFNNRIQNYDYIFQNNISYKLSDSTTLDLHMNAQIYQRNGVGESVDSLFGYARLTNPVMMVPYYPDSFLPDSGHVLFGNEILTDTRVRTNPYGAMMDDHKESKYNTLNTSLKLNQKLDFITKGLEFTGLVNWKNWSGVYYTQSKSPYYYRIKSGSWDVNNPDFFELEELAVGNNYVTEEGGLDGTDNTFYADLRVNYNRSFGKHNVSALLMMMMRSYQSTGLPNRNMGYSGRATYDYDQRYFVEFNFGYNGTERLPKGERYEFFPAVSLGWVPSNEKFWEPMKNVIDYLKIRGSYGLVGSDGFGGNHFVYFDDISINGGGTFWMGPNKSGGTSYQSHAVSGYAIQNATWERVKKLNLGVDFTLFRELSGTVEYFKDKRDRIMLQRASWPLIMGYWNATPWGQVGEAESHGFEASLNWDKQINKDLQISFRGNFSYNQNKYIYKDEPDYNSVWQRQTGMPLNGYRTEGYIAEGLFESEEEIANSPDQLLGTAVRPGDIKYRDVNGDGRVDGDDKALISPYGRTPRIQYGLGANLRWKNWDLGVFFNGSAKRTIIAGNVETFGTDDRNVMQWVADNAWTMENPNPNAKYPRLGLTAADNANNMETSTFWMHSGNFLRFKTLEIGYNFKFGRVYVTGDNIAVWSPFNEWDPELYWDRYPLNRTFTLGVQLRF